ncbi:uncharacterized protein LOC135929274 isoform X2 [Gordionus sp. m RMFG-2023]|uniref:uncharacterized protein LOC135929274 isoform X2 n=1 Tax=Gordionus sp. m RMFG-2023 TaxID=3053472 RepID=UPI0031FC5606
MEKLMTSAEFHLRDIQYRLTTLESLINHDSDSSKSQDSNQDPFTELLTYLTKGFSEIDGLAREIETRLFKEINATQTGKATLRLRLEQIKYDARHLRASLDHINAKRESKLRASKERQALLSTRFAPNSPSSSSTIDIAGENEYFGNEKSKLRQAGSGVDTLLEAGKVNAKTG